MNEPKRRGRPPKLLELPVVDVQPQSIDPAQAYANRVWSGQSDHVPRNERLERVRKALEGQGLSMEGVVL